MRERYDVLVAGAGPAGLAIAEPLAERGYSVLVCEKAPEIGKPVRTSGGSWIEDLRALGLPDHLWHPIDALRFQSASLPNAVARSRRLKRPHTLDPKLER